MDHGVVESQRCPVCGVVIEEPPVRCQRCQTAHHAECFEYAGGCAIFGCRVSRPPAQARDGRADLLLHRTALSLALHRGHGACFALTVLGFLAFGWSTVVPWCQPGVDAPPVRLAGQIAACVGTLGIWLTCGGLCAWLMLLIPTQVAWRRLRRAASQDGAPEPVSLIERAASTPAPASGSPRDIVGGLESALDPQVLRALTGALAVSLLVALAGPMLKWCFPDAWRSSGSLPYMALVAVLYLSIAAGACMAWKHRLGGSEEAAQGLLAALKGRPS